MSDDRTRPDESGGSAREAWGRPAPREGREALPAQPDPRRKRRRGGEPDVVPEATPTSYYGQPIINRPVWQAPDIPGYLYLGGLAGASSVLAAGADLTGRVRLARDLKVAATGAVGLSLVALIHDLGRPARFLNMLRVFKPRSPMSVGSWLLSAYGTASAGAAGSALTGVFPRTGRAATLGAALLGPAVAAYTAVLLSDTAVPAWHEAYRELPFLFTGSAAASAAGLALVTGRPADTAPARRAAVLAAATELGAETVLRRRLGKLGEPYHEGKAGRLMRAAGILTGAGALGAATAGARSRAAAAGSGLALMAGSALSRFAVFQAGFVSADDPAYTVGPQRARLDEQREQESHAHE